MLKKSLILVVLSLILLTATTYAFAQCAMGGQNKDQKATCGQCCCCKCAR